MSRSLLSRQQGVGNISGIWARSTSGFDSIATADRHFELRSEAFDLFAHVFKDFESTVLPRLIAVDCDIDSGLNVEEGDIASEAERDAFLLDSPRTPSLRGAVSPGLALATPASLPQDAKVPMRPTSSRRKPPSTSARNRVMTPLASSIAAARHTPRPPTNGQEGDKLLSSLLGPKRQTIGPRQRECHRLLGYVRAFLFGETWASAVKTSACHKQHLEYELQRFGEEYTSLQRVANHRIKVMAKAVSSFEHFPYPLLMHSNWPLPLRFFS